MVRIFSRYFAARFLALFGGVLLVSILVVASVEVLLNLDDMLRSGDRASGALRYLFLRIPSYYWNSLVPLAAATAGFLCMGLAGHRFEIVATRAGGIPLARLIGPVLLAATGVAIFSLGIDETWIVDSHRGWAQQEEKQLRLRDDRLWYHHGRRIYRIGRPDLSNRKIYGVEIFELNPNGRLHQKIYADLAIIQSESGWRLQNVLAQKFDPSNPAALPKIEAMDEVQLELAPNVDDILLASNPSSLGIGDLLDGIQRASRDANPEYILLTALHQRLAQPGTILLLALIGIAFGLRVERSRSFGLPAAGIVLTLGIFYGLRSGLSILGTGGVVPGSAIWLLLLAFAALAFLFVSRAPR